MKRASLVSQNTLNRIYQEVNEAWKRCDFQPAIEMLENVSRRDPANSEILLHLGRMYGQRYDYVAAERCLERALRVTGQKTEVLLAAGQQCRSFNQLTLAETYLKRALEHKDATPDTAVALGEIYERQRRTTEALDLANRALKASANHPQARHLKARLERQAGNFEAAESLLRELPDNAEPSLRAGAKYELGGILDRQGRYDEAMAAFREAKALLLPQAARPTMELKVMRARLQHLTTNATDEVLRNWRAAGDQLQPPHRLTLLAGHPRSGTTLLEQVLDAHPDLISAEETEIFYQDAYGPRLQGQPDDTGMYDALAKATPEQLQQSRKNYFRSLEQSLGQPIGGRLLIDKNPSFTFLIPAFVRIFPETKFLIALRDPRDVVLSCFMQNLPLNQVGAACLSLTDTTNEYVELMGTWRTLAPRLSNPYLEVRYEDMVEDLEGVARKTLDFLGAPWNPKVLGFDQHAREKVVRSPTYADVTQPVYKRAVGRWRHYQKYLEPHLEKLEPFVKAFGYE
ncbi:MAG: sulfotransferase [Verrucomicrobiae bacterium]